MNIGNYLVVLLLSYFVSQSNVSVFATRPAVFNPNAQVPGLTENSKNFFSSLSNSLPARESDVHFLSSTVVNTGYFLYYQYLSNSSCVGDSFLTVYSLGQCIPYSATEYFSYTDYRKSTTLPNIFYLNFSIFTDSSCTTAFTGYPKRYNYATVCQKNSGSPIKIEYSSDWRANMSASIFQATYSSRQSCVSDRESFLTGSGFPFDTCLVSGTNLKNSFKFVSCDDSSYKTLNYYNTSNCSSTVTPFLRSTLHSDNCTGSTKSASIYFCEIPAPTSFPTSFPTSSPSTSAPSIPTLPTPTFSPTFRPTRAPTTASPSFTPTQSPTELIGYLVTNIYYMAVNGCDDAAQGTVYGFNVCILPGGTTSMKYTSYAFVNSTTFTAVLTNYTDTFCSKNPVSRVLTFTTGCQLVDGRFTSIFYSAQLPTLSAGVMLTYYTANEVCQQNINKFMVGYNYPLDWCYPDGSKSFQYTHCSNGYYTRRLYSDSACTQQTSATNYSVNVCSSAESKVCSYGVTPKIVTVDEGYIYYNRYYLSKKGCAGEYFSTVEALGVCFLATSTTSYKYTNYTPMPDPDDGFTVTYTKYSDTICSKFATGYPTIYNYSSNCQISGGFPANYRYSLTWSNETLTSSVFFASYAGQSTCKSDPENIIFGAAYPLTWCFPSGNTAIKYQTCNDTHYVKYSYSNNKCQGSVGANFTSISYPIGNCSAKASSEYCIRQVTSSPTPAPSISPYPTHSPFTLIPTKSPTLSPIPVPTRSPTRSPTKSPTLSPTVGEAGYFVVSNFEPDARTQGTQDACRGPAQSTVVRIGKCVPTSSTSAYRYSRYTSSSSSAFSLLYQEFSNNNCTTLKSGFPKHMNFTNACIFDKSYPYFYWYSATMPDLSPGLLSTSYSTSTECENKDDRFLLANSYPMNWCFYGGPMTTFKTTKCNDTHYQIAAFGDSKCSFNETTGFGNYTIRLNICQTTSTQAKLRDTCLYGAAPTKQPSPSPTRSPTRRPTAYIEPSFPPALRPTPAPSRYPTRAPTHPIPKENSGLSNIELLMILIFALLCCVICIICGFCFYKRKKQKKKRKEESDFIYYNNQRRVRLEDESGGQIYEMIPRRDGRGYDTSNDHRNHAYLAANMVRSPPPGGPVMVMAAPTNPRRHRPLKDFDEELKEAYADARRRNLQEFGGGPVYPEDYNSSFVGVAPSPNPMEYNSSFTTGSNDFGGLNNSNNSGGSANSRAGFGRSQRARGVPR